MYYVYLLISETHLEEYYIGSTNDLRRRLVEHNLGDSPSTARYKPWKLVYYEAYLTEELARMREKRLKHHGSGKHELMKRALPSPSFTQPQFHPAPVFKKTGAGFTLMELVVAVAIIAGLGTVLVQALFTTTRSSTKVERLTDVKQGGEYALNVIERMIRNAQSLTAVCSSSGTTPTSSAIITSPDGYQTTFTCASDGGVTRIASASAFGTQFLTSSSVTLGGASCDADTLAFYCTSIADTPKSVKVTFQLSQKGTPVDQFEKASTTFQTSIGLRNQ